ncbi:hypothetical protein SAMN04488544_3321 [Microlunatus sagamiharensis]|uniref:Uncharacterized protein n=1 Tax=Microlunatus sagamiharensis TaxID=546874 RepID=A0A1H2N6N8_9ACTN|nr:hypothetical protein [Microlunatus sagamiharensis]SDV00456.1 hypothetical protein SAMN04488544_3321 [Microlunatus sagamiharensis]
MSLNGIELAGHREQLEAYRLERASHPAWNPLPEPERNATDEHADEIGDYVSRYNQRIREVEEDRGLSDEGKLELKARIYEEAQAKVGAMRAASDEIVSSRTNELTRSLFGITSSMDETSFRDARARVAKADPQALCDLMDEAEALGDRTLLRAGFARAWEKSREDSRLTSPVWAGIVEEYVRQNPSTAPKVAELSNLLTGPGLTGQQVRKAQTTVRKPKGIR